MSCLHMQIAIYVTMPFIVEYRKFKLTSSTLSKMEEEDSISVSFSFFNDVQPRIEKPTTFTQLV